MRRFSILQSSPRLTDLSHFASLTRLLGAPHAMNEAGWIIEHVIGKKRYDKIRYDGGNSGSNGAGSEAGMLTARSPAPLSSFLSSDELSRVDSLLHARAELRQPLQYLLGSVNFLGLPLLVRPPTLIPRPETECIVGWTLTRWAQRDYRALYKHRSITHETKLSEVARWCTRADRNKHKDAESGDAATATKAKPSVTAVPPSSSSSAVPPLRVLDLCSGSGNIALSLAHHMPYPSVRVVGVDASPSALRLARDIATALLEGGWIHQAGRSVTCEFAEVNLLQRSPHPPLPAPSADPLANALLNPPACVEELVRLAGAPSSASSSGSARPSPLLSSLSSSSSSLGGPYHLLVSNPPYIPSAELTTLEPEVRLWEDPAALIAGTDGMQLYDVILRALPSLLRPLPLRSATSAPSADGELDTSDGDVPELVLEIGSAMQALQLTERLSELGFGHVTVHHDLADLPRWVAAARKPATK